MSNPPFGYIFLQKNQKHRPLVFQVPAFQPVKEVFREFLPRAEKSKISFFDTLQAQALGYSKRLRL